MNQNTEYFFLEGPAGKLQCALDLPQGEEQALRGFALVAHPHPLYQGTMDNKVVHTLVRSFTTLGYAAIRMNFRGVGESAGEHDRGHGETDDLAILLQAMQEKYPGLPFALAGFSFGTFVAATLNQRLVAEGKTTPERLVLVGSPPGKWPMPPVPANTILIHGERDETIPLADVFAWAGPQDLPVIVVTTADHFFHRKLQHIKNFVVDMWRR